MTSRRSEPSAQIESFHRFVQDEQIRLSKHGLGQREPLNHSLAETGDRFIGTVGHVPPVRAARARGRARADGEIPESSP